MIWTVTVANKYGTWDSYTGSARTAEMAQKRALKLARAAGCTAPFVLSTSCLGKAAW